MSGWVVFAGCYLIAIVACGLFFGALLARRSAPLPEEHEGRDAA